MAAIIRIRNLIYEYRREGLDGGEGETFRAIDNLNLDIEEGSFVAVIGPNGSGKSTLARNLNGLLLPTEGSVLVDGMDTRDEARIWDVRSTVGMVFQNPDNQIVSSVVEDDVAFGPENLGIPPEEIRRRVDEALRDVGMWEQRRKAPHMLSGGQKQRIAIAGVIAMRPRCIVFDEPTAMLDPEGRKQILKILHRLHREGITVVLITHFMEEVAQAERVVVMRSGRLYFDAAPREWFADADRVRDAGLELPPVAELRDRVARHGYNLPKELITEEELIDALCLLK